MKLVDKFKNLFTEEQEVEVPIKKEVKHVEITPPKETSEKLDKELEETVELEKEQMEESPSNREEKFKFPAYFTDEDFDDLKKAEPVYRKEEVKVEPPKSEPYKPIIEEKKQFKLSPIISPVYGVLGENYKKEDIPVSDKIQHAREEKVTIDDIRNKAYGTLEDDFDHAFTRESRYEVDEDVTIDIFEELEKEEKKTSKDLLKEEIEDTVDLTEQLERQKKKIEEINEFIKQNSKEEELEETKELELGQDEKVKEEQEDLEQTKELELEQEKKKELEETKELELEQEKKKELEETKELEVEEIKEDVEEKNYEEETQAVESTIDNGDLFSLIDSMYEKRDDE